jgi:hypothetical protein
MLNALFDPQRVGDPKGNFPPYVDQEYHDKRHDLPDPPGPPEVGRRLSQYREPTQVPLVIVSGVVNDGFVEVSRVLRMTTGPTTNGRRLEGMTAELLDGNGEVIGRAPLRWTTAHAEGGCGCGCGGRDPNGPPSGLFHAMIPDPGNGVSVIRVVHDEKELWSRGAPVRAPSVEDVAAKIDDGVLRVRWRASAVDSYQIERAVRWSADDGATWQVLAVALREDEAIVPVAMLTAGSVLIEVHVSDGFHGVVSHPARVDVPVRDPEVAILSPSAGEVVRTEALLRLWGVATASDGRQLLGEELRWELDGRVVGTGAEVWLELPEWDGEHRVTLRAMDGDMRGQSSQIFLATRSGRAPILLRDDSTSLR